MLNQATTKLLLLIASIALISSQSWIQCRPTETTSSLDDNSVSAVIPSPNQDFGDGASMELSRRSGSDASQQQAQASNSVPASAPVYVSPFARSERLARAAIAPATTSSSSASAPLAATMANSFERRESSLAHPNFAPRPSLALEPKDLKAAASYGHQQHGGHHQGYDTSGWLDMGAWTGGKGSFGWYADYPVGGKHGYGYGRK